MRVLVTGGAGFIGSHLVDALVQHGHQVRVLDNLEAQVHEGRPPAYVNPAAEYRWADVRNRDAVRAALERIEVVFHEAAAVGVGQSMYQIEKYVAVNALGTSVLLDTIINDKVPIKKLIVASSMSIYGEGQYRCPSCGPVFPNLRPETQLAQRSWEMRCPRCRQAAAPEATTEEKPLFPTSVYAVSKRDQEELCLTVGRSYRIPTVALRYFNVYGPRQALSNPYTGVCAIFSSRLKHAHPPLIFEDGGQSRDFVHVSDIVRANLFAMQEPRADYQALNVGTGRRTSIAEIARMLAELYQAPVSSDMTQKYRAGDIRHCYADVSALRALGFSSSTRLEDGLRELVEWGRTTEAVDRVEAASMELETRGLTRG